MILAIDTAGPWVSAAVGDGAALLAADVATARLNHNETLAPMVRRLLGEAGVVRPDKIAVDIGPGSFTGTRVGVSYAVGLAQGWGLPMLAVSSFHVAAPLTENGGEVVYVALPLAGSLWCRARLRWEKGAWVEESLEELPRDAVAADLDGVELVVPWGDLAAGIHPPANWNPAAELLSLTSAVGAELAPGSVRVRYVGLSQAERKFHARKQSC